MAVRTERIEARIDPERAESIRCAAQLSHTSLSAFVTEAAFEKAEQVLLEERTTIVPAEFFDRLVQALDEPGRAVPSLQAAAARRREVLKPR